MTAAVAILYTLVILPTVIKGESQIKTVFSVPYQNFPLRNIEYDPQSSSFFVSGKNVLYKFTVDGAMKSFHQKVKKVTGPKPNCFELEEDNEKYCGNDQNSVMVVTPNRLITCSTLYGGRCIKREKENLNDTSIDKDERTIALVSDATASAVGSYITVHVKGNTDEPLLIFAKQYTPLKPLLAKLDRSSIFSVSPDLTGKVFENKLRKDMILDEILTESSKDRIILDYRTLFENSEFIFLLVNQKDKISKSSHSKLIKICKTIDQDDPKRVYEDIPITCSSGGTNLTNVMHGTFVSHPDGRYLVVLFSDSDGSTAICVYSEDYIYRGFLDSRKDRYECPRHDLSPLELIFDGAINPGSCVDLSSDKELPSGVADAFNESNPKFCNDVVHEAPQYGIIIGSRPLTATALYTSQDKSTVVGSKIVNGLITLYVGTHEGSVIKIYLDHLKNKASELERIRLDSSNIRAIRNVGEGEIYIMSENKIVNILEKNCESFNGDCNSCMMAKDAGCGWCILTKRCVEKSSCPDQTNFWLPSVRNQCLQLRMNREEEYGVILDNPNENGLSKNVYFEPPVKDFSNMTCKLGNEIISLSPQTDHVTCHVANLPSSNVGNVTLSILLKGDVIASTDLLYYNCSTFERCGQCVENGRTQCYWCPNKGLCTFGRGGCSNLNDAVGKLKTDKCPQVLPSTMSVPNGQKESVTFSGRNLKSFYAYSCIINEKTHKGTFISESSIRCEDVQVSYPEEKSISDAIEISFSYAVNETQTPDMVLDKLKGETYLKAYKCEFLSANKEDCSTCNYQRSLGYQDCVYCETSGCTSRASCPSPEPCLGPKVKEFEPMSGPVGGGTKLRIKGTNLGERASFINNVTVAGVMCINITLKDREIECTTEASSELLDKSGSVVVTVQQKKSAPSEMKFHFKNPVITDIYPNESIQSGGGVITIVGENLNIGNTKYEVSIVPIPESDANLKRKACNNPTAKKNYIVCRPAISENKGKHRIEVTFDGNTERRLTGSKVFTYLDDPSIQSTDPATLETIKSGGTKFVVKGTGFAAVLQTLYVGLQEYPQSTRAPCMRLSDTKVECEFPGVPSSSTPRRRRRKRQVSDTDAREYDVEIHMDGFRQILPGRTLYVSNPSLVGNRTISFDPEEQQDIVLSGSNLAIVTRKEDYFILVGSGECAITRLNETELVCRPPSREPAPRAQEDQLYIRVRVGNYKETIGVLEYANQLPITYIVIGVLAFLLIVIIVGAVLIHRKMRARNQLKIKEIMTEMQDIEQNTMQMNQEEFAEMQLNITDIKRDLVSTGIPYHPYQNYVQYILFPKEVEAGTLNSLIKHSGYASKNVEKAMDQFDKLMTNKYFVKSLIGTLEKQRKITLIDKAQFSANFSVVMMGKMRDFFDIVNCLLSTLVDSANKKAHKTLFNRFESITLRLLSHWLSVSLYPHLKEGGGSSLFMLYKSTQAVVEKRPVDEVTGEAKNTLSEDSFLREKIDCQALKLEIDLNGNGNLYTCEVLDCDTINQVKSKCLYQIYKNKPASEMPTIDEVDLEWMAGKSGRLALSNIDQTSVREDNMVRRNTLQHYNVLDGSKMALLYKFSPDDEHTEEHEEDPYVNQRSPSDVEISIPPDVHLIQSVSSTGSLEHLRQWHLIKSLEEEEDSHEKTVKLKDIVKTSHITNLMHTKLVLQDNIKEVFDSVLNHDTVPLVVHYLFGVLENLANKNGVEPDTLLCWKSESYAMRVWATLLVRPEFLFDIQKVKHVEPCLNVIKQVFIDCFHSTKISKDSSLQKLLFAQEVPHYQKKTEQFYKALANKAAVTDSDFWSEMSRLNGLQQEHLKFSKAAALQKLYKFVQQYVEDIIEDLDAGDETSDLQFGSKLDDVVRLMETDS